MKKFFSILLLLSAFMLPYNSEACTSVIVSGKARPDGRPVMFKHRDTKKLDNAIARFQGERYAFLGLVNADWREKVGKKGQWPEVWAGMNEAGFCIMNTATYDFNDDNVPSKKMDREGLLMYRALEICATVADFEYFLDTLSQPRCVEANFGVIDAQGGAAYFETGNYKTFKYDVNEEAEHYRVVTNFTRHGRKEDRKGEDRYEVTLSKMPEGAASLWGHDWLINSISRQGKPVLRDISSSVVVFEGVASGENPSNCVMWACVGFPTAAPIIPLKVWDEDLTPQWLQALPTSVICDKALEIKWEGAVPQCLEVEQFLDRRFRSDMSQCGYKRLMRRTFRLWQKAFQK